MGRVHCDAVLIGARRRRQDVLLQWPPGALSAGIRSFRRHPTRVRSFTLGLCFGKSGRLDFEVSRTVAQISHDTKAGGGTVCGLKAGDAGGKKRFEVTKLVCAVVNHVRC